MSRTDRVFILVFGTGGLLSLLIGVTAFFRDASSAEVAAWLGQGWANIAMAIVITHVGDERRHR